MRKEVMHASVGVVNARVDHVSKQQQHVTGPGRRRSRDKVVSRSRLPPSIDGVAASYAVPARIRPIRSPFPTISITTTPMAPPQSPNPRLTREEKKN